MKPTQVVFKREEESACTESVVDTKMRLRG
jgi:hypothetical protein